MNLLELSKATGLPPEELRGILHDRYHRVVLHELAPVNTEAETACRRKSVFKRSDVIVIDLCVAVRLLGLLLRALACAASAAAWAASAAA